MKDLKKGLTDHKKHLKNAIKRFEDKIAKQGRITNARDEMFLIELKNELKKC